MSRFLKTFHLTSLGLGFLAVFALTVNCVIFGILYPQVTQFMEMDPNWETYGVVVGINIIILALFQLISMITLLAYLLKQKRTSALLIFAIVTGIISGLMIMGDMALLSDIGKEYQLGWQTRGEWIILFISYGLHILSLVLAMTQIIRSLNEAQAQVEQIMKDEVLFLSLHSTGVICGALGLIAVIAGLISDLSLWMIERLVVVMGMIILSPYLVLLGIWIFRRKLGDVTPGLDEKQFHDLAVAGMWTMVGEIPLMVIFFSLRFFPVAKESWDALWLPLLVFPTLTTFSSLTLGYFRDYS
jgi:hypothetical protein